MTGILLKKQMMEVFAWVYQDKKTGKNRTRKGLFTYVLFYLGIFGFLGVIFYKLSETMCAPLVQSGFSWLYMALMGLMGVTLGVFGSVFNTYSSLYQAKDNDLLLSMPLKPRQILIARLFGVYAMGLMYEMLVMIPAVVVYFMEIKINITGVIFCLLLPFVLSVFVLTLSCILGWVVALCSSKLKNKKIITVLISLMFMGAYFYFCGNVSSLLQSLLLQPKNIAEKVKGVLYPFYQMGLAAEGKPIPMLLFSTIVLVIFAAVYLLLQNSFLKLATSKTGEAKGRYIEKKAHLRSLEQTLLYKEFRRFFQSPNYMLNCGLGIVFMPVGAILLLVKQDVIISYLNGPLAGYQDMILLMTVAAICCVVSMNDMAAPSISLEGKNLWLLQVLPVSGWQVLKAKLKMHMILTLIPAAVLLIAVEWILKPGAVWLLLIPLSVVLFSFVMAAFGLLCNLKSPNLSWTSEIVPIKQSMSVMLALFGGWVLVILFAVAYYFLAEYISAVQFISICDMILMVSFILLLSWLKKKGTSLFETLGTGSIS